MSGSVAPVAEPEQDQLVDDRLDEWFYCRTHLLHWLTRHVKVLDKVSGCRVPFEPYPGQLEILRRLISGFWVWLLKSRRLGATAVVLVYILHELSFWPDKRAIMVSQDKPTAIELIDWYNNLDNSQPGWMRQRRVVDNTERIVYANDSALKVVAGSARTGRSLDCDILLADEGAYIQYLADVRRAAEPTLETGKGVSIIMSTSDGPGNEFERGFWASQGPHRDSESVEQVLPYHQMFLDWRQRPGRDDAWHTRMIRQGGFLARYEYPSNPVEAFEAGAGRMFPSFRRLEHVVHCDCPEGALLYRSMDFGSSATSPFVCLWAWHDPNSIPRLTFEPGCETIEESPETIGEFAAGIKQMVAYCRDDKGQRIKLNDDLPDALRYLVTSFRMFGHVHIYQLLFLRSGSHAGSLRFTDQEWGRRIMEMSGWELRESGPNNWRPGPDVEHYAATIGDKSGLGFINLLNAQFSQGGFELGVAPYMPIEGVPKKKEVETGVHWLNNLIQGEWPMEATRDMTAVEKMRQQVERGERLPTPKDLTNLAWQERLRQDRMMRLNAGRRVWSLR